MPVVPTYQPGQVAPQATPFVPQSAASATLDVFGGNTARALTEAGATVDAGAEKLNRILIQRQIDDNEREAKRLDVELSSRLRTIGYGDGTAENQGFYALQGENALNSVKDTKERMRRAKLEIAGQVKNVKVLDMFGQSADVRIEQELGAVDRFTLRAREVANDATDEARISEARDDAATNPDYIPRSLAVVQGTVDAISERKGYSDVAKAARLAQDQTAVISGAVDTALQRDATTGMDTAREIYYKYRDKVSGAVRADIEKKLETNSLLRKSQETTTSLMTRFPNDPAGAKAEARKITSARLQQAVIVELQSRYAEQKADAGYNRPEMSQEAAASYHQNSRSRPEALASARRDFKGADLVAVEGRINELYDRDLKTATEDRLATATQKSDEIIRSSRNETEALAAVGKIENPEVRAATSQLVQAAYADTRRIAAEQAKREAPDIAAEIAKDKTLTEAAQIQKARDKYDGELEAEVIKGLEHIHTKQKQQEDRDKGRIAADAYNAMYDKGMTFAEWRREHPEEQAIIAGDGTLMGSLQNADRAVREGRVYATVSDDEVRTKVLNMPTEELARVDLQGLKAVMTRKDHDEITRKVVAAKARVEATQENLAVFSAGSSALKRFAPKKMVNKQYRDALKPSQLQAAENEMTAFINGFTSQGKLPTQEVINAEAARIMTQVEADPPGLFNRFEGVAGDLKRMTAEQKATARVPMEVLRQDRSDLMERIRAAITLSGKNPDDEDLVEQIAGAIVLKDVARRNRLLGLGE